jgi:hypothetical protein
MKKTPLLLLAALAALSAPLACDFEKTGSQLQAQKVMVATLLATPPVDLTAAGLLGLDGGFDAGVDLDGGAVNVPGQVAAFVFFGNRKSQTLDIEPEPIANATVRLAQVGGAEIALENQGSGNYSVVAGEDGGLSYQSGATYQFRAVHGGATYVGQLEEAPALERIEAFHPASGYVDHPANTAFTFTRPSPPAGQDRTPAFVTLYPLGEDGAKGQPTYTNAPKTPLDFLKLVARPQEWTQAQVTIPAEQFPAAGQSFVVTLQAVKLGGPESDNLFTGSAILVGTAEAGVIRTR